MLQTDYRVTDAVFSAILKEIEDDEPKTVEDPAPAQAAFCSIA